MKRMTREWVRKAEGDFVAIGKLVRGPEASHDAVCFHCQQCAEKYLKALLEELGQTVPRTHQLDDLLGMLRTRYPSLVALRRGLLFLNDFAVAVRYPMGKATKRRATSAVSWAKRVRDACRALLGLRAPKTRRKSP